MPMRSPSRRIRIATLIVAALGVLLVGAWGVLAIAFPPARVRALIAAELQRSFRRPVQFSDVGVTLLPPVRLHAGGVALAEPQGFAAGTAVRVRRVDLDLDAWALLRRALVVRRLTLESPALHLVLRRDGSTNLDSLLAPAPRRQGAPMDLDVQSFVIRDGQVLLDDLGARRRTSVHVATTLAFSSRSAGRQLATRGHTECSQLAFGPLTARRLQDFNRAFAPLTWTLDHAGRFDAGASRLTLD